MNLLGQKIKKLREEKNKDKKLTQVDVAAAIGVSRPFLTAIENGREYPGRETLLAIANYYNVSLDWLTGDQKDNTSMESLNEQEALLLYAYRHMDTDKAEMFLKLMLDSCNKK